MSSLTKHLHLLFHEEDYHWLQRLAQGQKTTVAQLIRSAVKIVYGDKNKDKKQAAGERLLAKKDLKVSDYPKMEAKYLKRYE